jgi:hypothetical protein
VALLLGVVTNSLGGQAAFCNTIGDGRTERRGVAEATGVGRPDDGGQIEE